MQRLVDGSQMRPEVVPPQSPSSAQPHCPPVRQRLPATSAWQPVAFVGVHSTQPLVEGEQTRPPLQSVSARHPTQFPEPDRSQTGSGSAQPPSPVQEVGAVQVPTPPVIPAQVCPVGHPLRGAGPQPGVQKPPGPLQIMPDVGPPQALSPSGPVQPQRPVAGRHCGVAPVHLDVLVGVHSVHAPVSGPVSWQTGRSGVAPQSPSALHPRQVCVAVLQTGAVLPHWASLTQETQVPVAVSHTPVGAAHLVALVAEQTPHAPLGWQAGVVPPQSVSPAQPRQVCWAGSQTGVVPLHCALVTQDTQVPVATSHTVEPVQRAALVAEQTPHAPPGWQAGVDPPQSVSPAQPRQVCAPVLQTGVAPEQSALVRHPTQVPLPTSHTSPVHLLLLVAEQTPHAPPGWQAGVAPPQSVSPAQGRQVCVPLLQVGVAPEHWALLTQETQVPLETSHTPVAPEQPAALVAEQTPHAPFGWQAGVVPPQSESPAQPRQVFVAVLQTGVAPEHWTFDVHGTQVPVAISHTGVGPAQVVAFVAEQTPQAPLGWQAVAPPHSESPEQPRQLRNAGSQTGVAPLQSEEARHPTQAWDATLHMGVVPPQVALVTHATHWPSETSQAGVAPVQWLALVAEQAPQEPLGWQAGALAGQSLSAAQARQVCVPASQVGLLPEQSAAAMQATQACGETVVRHKGVLPLQSLLLAQPSTVTGVGGAPGPLPFPSEM